LSRRRVASALAIAGFFLQAEALAAGGGEVELRLENRPPKSDLDFSGAVGLWAWIEAGNASPRKRFARTARSWARRRWRWLILALPVDRTNARGAPRLGVSEF
jgi:hypothetical protein